MIMVLFCEKCGNEFEKKNYNNIYGTKCPYCGGVVKSVKKPKFIKDADEKMLELRIEFLEKLRKRLKETK